MNKNFNNNASTGCLCALFLFLQVLTNLAYAQTPSSIDYSFNPDDKGIAHTMLGFDAEVRALVVQPDGKAIVGGDFSSFSLVPQHKISRLTTSGTIDSTFNAGSGFLGNIYAMAMLTNGTLLVGGNFDSYNGISSNNIACLNTDGSLNAGFISGTGADSTIQTITVQPDGKIIIAGDFQEYNGVPCGKIVRLNADGSIDTGFSAGSGANHSIRTVTLQPNGKILIGGYFWSFNGMSCGYLLRLNSNGTIDTTFNIGNGMDNAVHIINLQPDGKILVGGKFSHYNSIVSPRVARLNSDGTFDPSFDIPGVGPLAPSSGPTNLTEINAIAVMPDGKIIIAGRFNQFNNTFQKYNITRIFSDGTLDESFNDLTSIPGINNTPGASGKVNKLAVLPNGDMIIAGNIVSYNGINRGRVARIHPTGMLDATFAHVQGATSWVRSIIRQPDGKLVIIGLFSAYADKLRSCIARLHADGTLDTTFVPVYRPTNYYRCVAVQPDGKIIAGGLFNAVSGPEYRNLIRFNTDGSTDTTFNIGMGPSAEVKSILVQPDGKILIGGSFGTYNGAPAYRLVRLNPDGSLDPDFNIGSGPDGSVYSLALQPDGNIIVAGWFSNFNSEPRASVARVLSNGALDTSFYSNAIFSQQVNTAKLQADGKIILAGNFYLSISLPVPNNYNSHAMIRLNTDGSLDTTFAVGMGPYYEINTVDIQPDGKILVGGNFTSFDYSPQTNLTRLNSDGTIDQGFLQTPGPNERVLTSVVLPDGKIMIGGGFTNINGEGRNYIARLQGGSGTGAGFNSFYHLNFCQGYTADIAFQAAGSFNPGNIFTVQLSDPQGTFTNPTAIGSIPGVASGSITITIPANAQPGSNYRMRLVSSDPATVSLDNGSNINISMSPFTTASVSPDSAGPGDVVTLFVTNPNPGMFYEWQGPDSFLMYGDTVLVQLPYDGTLTYTVVSSSITSCMEYTPVSVYSDASLLIQTNNWNWANSGGSGLGFGLSDNGISGNSNNVGRMLITGGETGIAIASSASGETTTLARFKGTATFGTTTLTASGDEDMVLLRTNAAGAILWAARAGSADSEKAKAVSMDAQGTSYITGSFAGIANFGTHSLTSTGTEDAFITSYNSTGTVNWAVKAGGNQTTIATGITTDAQGNSTITGLFSGTAIFGPHSLTSNGDADIFVARYDASGNAVWAKNYGSTAEDGAYSVAIDDQGNTYITGTFTGTINFGSITLTSISNRSKFMAKLDNSGNVLWAKTTGTAAAADDADKIATNNSQLYTTGTFEGTASFGTTTLTSIGADDIYVAAYFLNGNPIWAKRAGGAGDDIATGITTDTEGLCYITGSYNAGTGFGLHRLSSLGGEDIFVAKYDMAGNALWARKAGGIGNDAGLAIAVDAQGNSYTTGYFSGRATFGDEELFSNGAQDMFVARLGHITAVGIEEESTATSAINVYPNPFRNSFSVNFTSTSSKAEVILTDVLGKQIFSKTYPTVASETTLQIQPENQLPQGLYLLQIKQNDQTQTVRIIKQ